MFEDRRGWLGMGKGAVREYPRTGGASSEVAKRAQSAAASSRPACGHRCAAASSRPARGQLAASSRPACGRHGGGGQLAADDPARTRGRRPGGGQLAAGQGAAASSRPARGRRPARGQLAAGQGAAASSRPARGRRPGGAKIFLDKSFCLCQDFFMKFVFFIFSRGLSWFFKFSPTCPALPLGCLDSSLICVDGPWLKCEKKFSSVQEGLLQ